MKIFTLLFVFLFSTAALAGECEIGPWRLGMSKEKICSFKEFGPYYPVRITGGAETFNAFFDGKNRNISFVFDDSGLKLIQVWYYEGDDSNKSLDGMMEIFRLFKTQYDGGQITTRDAPDKYSDDSSMRRYLLQQMMRFKRQQSRAKGSFQEFFMKPGQQPDSSTLVAKWYLNYKENMFYAFLFQNRAGLARR